MELLIEKLGIDFKLLASQAVNFILLIFILYAFLYKPLLKTIKERQEKIAEGIEKTNKAEERLKESAMLAAEKLKEAEREALEIKRKAEQQAKEEEAKLLAQAHYKEEQILKKAEEIIKSKSQEALKEAEKEAGKLIKETVAKIAELDPKMIDDKLIQKALELYISEKDK